MRAALALLCALALTGLLCADLHAASYGPRRSLEGPGGVRSGVRPGGGESGYKDKVLHGHTDAYGNPVEYRKPEEKAPKRLRPGASGRKTEEAPRPLPDPDANKGTPAWKFD